MDGPWHDIYVFLQLRAMEFGDPLFRFFLQLRAMEFAHQMDDLDLSAGLGFLENPFFLAAFSFTYMCCTVKLGEIGQPGSAVDRDFEFQLSP